MNRDAFEKVEAECAERGWTVNIHFDYALIETPHMTYRHCIPPAPEWQAHAAEEIVKNTLPMLDRMLRLLALSGNDYRA